MEQDIEILANLYMQLENNTVMQRSLMESVNSGNTMPRMYEVFGQLTDKIQSINKQIFDTEQRIRKTYVDLKYEIRDKVSEDVAAKLADPVPRDMLESNGKVVVTSTRNLIASARAKHVDKINNAKEVEFKEEDQ